MLGSSAFLLRGRLDIPHHQPAAFTTKDCFLRIIPLNHRTYIGCGQNGTLATLFFPTSPEADVNEQININEQSMEITQHPVIYIKDGVRHDDSFLDIAVDASHKTSTGFKPRIALLNKNGEVFVTDFSLPSKKITLFLTSKIDIKKGVSYSILYDKSKIAVMKRRGNHLDYGGGTFTIISDNLAMHCWKYYCTRGFTPKESISS
jgi:hypothetical protein